MSTASVVIVSYHTGSVLEPALASVMRQHGLSNVVLIDNGNPPDIVARLQQMSISDPRLVVVTGQGNVGFAAGCNLGVKQATGEYVMLLNPDCILPPGTLTTMMREINVLPNTMLAGVHLVNPSGSEQRGGRRSLLTPTTALGEVIGLKKLNRHHTEMPQETHDVPAISGACMFIRKVDYEAIGGMDEGYFLHVEDLDFCMRVAKMGKRIVCVPSVKVAHLLSTSGNTRTKFIERHKAKGFIRYFEKHFPGPTLPLLRACIWARYRLRKASGFIMQKKQKDLDASRKLIVLASSISAPEHVGALAGKTVLVTGATSQIGVYVITHLLIGGAAVLAVSREDPLPFVHPRLRWLKQDITRDDFSLGGYLADIAIHSAPIWYLPKIMPELKNSEVNRVVAIGSTSVFSKASSHNNYEKDLVAKHSKAEQEIARLGGELNMAWTILRPTMLYGLGLDKTVTALARFIERFGVAPLYPPAVGRRQPVHVEDVAIATLQAAATPETFNKSYNVSGGEIVTYRQMVLRIFEVLKMPPDFIETTLLPTMFSIVGFVTGKRHITRDVAYRMNEDLVFFHDDATRDFGYRPRAFLTSGLLDIEGME